MAAMLNTDFVCELFIQKFSLFNIISSIPPYFKGGFVVLKRILIFASKI